MKFIQIEIDCGEITCAVPDIIPGRHCKHLRLGVPACVLFDRRLKIFQKGSYINWAMRLAECMAAEKEPKNS
jgi:hypothetical protein